MKTNRRVVKKTQAVYRARSAAQGRPKLKLAGLKSSSRWFFAGAVFLLAWNYFSIRDIQISGNKNIETSRIETAVKESFKDHPFSRNMFTLGMAPLEEELLGFDHRIKTASVKRRWPNKIAVVISEREVALIWKSGSESFVIDTEGVVVGRSDELGLKLPEITDSTNLPVKVGTRVVSARFVSFCLGLIANMPQKSNLRISSMKVPETISEVHVGTHMGYLVKFDTTRTVEEQIADLNSVLATLATQNKRPREYIDLRIAGKAYYR